MTPPATRSERCKLELARNYSLKKELRYETGGKKLLDTKPSVKKACPPTPSPFPSPLALPLLPTLV